MRALPILALATLVAFAPLPAFAARNNGPATISVSGRGEVTAAPDMAEVTSGVITDAKTARAALSANTTAMAALMKALKAADIAPADIQTSGFSVAPQYVYPKNPDAEGERRPPTISGYEVRNTVAVRVRNLAGLGAVLDNMVSVGANSVSGISFSVADPSALLTKARQAAFANARQKATTYAHAAGIELGPIASIRENQSPVGPRPQMFKAMAARSAPVPVAAGELTYDVDVAVSWRIAKQ